jgi:hypothetical protein
MVAVRNFLGFKDFFGQLFKTIGMGQVDLGLEHRPCRNAFNPIRSANEALMEFYHAIMDEKP